MCTVDTDVVGLRLQYSTKSADELRLGSKFHYIPVHEVISGIDPRNCAVLPVMYSQDAMLSHLWWKRKEEFLEIWQVFPDVTKLSNTSF